MRRYTGPKMKNLKTYLFVPAAACILLAASCARPTGLELLERDVAPDLKLAVDPLLEAYGGVAAWTVDPEELPEHMRIAPHQNPYNLELRRHAEPWRGYGVFRVNKELYALGEMQGPGPYTVLFHELSTGHEVLEIDIKTQSEAIDVKFGVFFREMRNHVRRSRFREVWNERKDRLDETLDAAAAQVDWPAVQAWLDGYFSSTDIRRVCYLAPSLRLGDGWSKSIPLVMDGAAVDYDLAFIHLPCGDVDFLIPEKEDFLDIVVHEFCHGHAGRAFGPLFKDGEASTRVRLLSLVRSFFQGIGSYSEPDVYFDELAVRALTIRAFDDLWYPFREDGDSQREADLADQEGQGFYAIRSAYAALASYDRNRYPRFEDFAPEFARLVGDGSDEASLSALARIQGGTTEAE